MQYLKLTHSRGKNCNLALGLHQEAACSRGCVLLASVSAYVGRYTAFANINMSAP